MLRPLVVLFNEDTGNHYTVKIARNFVTSNALQGNKRGTLLAVGVFSGSSETVDEKKAIVGSAQDREPAGQVVLKNEVLALGLIVAFP